VSRPLVSTYSIVAYDAAAQEWGVAVQSKFLAVGSAVPFARAGVGAVATQALANVAYGPQGLELLAQDVLAAETLKRLVRADPGREHRQLGIVDRLGGSATFTGEACLPWAGGRSGPGYAAQGNVLTSAETVAALADSFNGSDRSGRSLAERLLGCLAAAQQAGGDRRGQQSAALLVVREKGGYGGGSDRLVDLRVDDHPRPIEELGRIFDIHQLLFGSTPPEEWLAVDEPLRVEIAGQLARRGYCEDSLEEAFLNWAGTENLEERVVGLERVDPVVLAALRKG
jgi:uncharacterized Ntn-hydrolase superfamily protein